MQWIDKDLLWHGWWNIKKMKKWKSKNLSWIFVLQGFVYLYHRGVRLPLSLHFPSHKFLAFGSFSRRFVYVHFYLHLRRTLRQNPDLLTAPNCNCTPVYHCRQQIWCLVTLSICAGQTDYWQTRVFAILLRWKQMFDIGNGRWCSYISN